MQIYTPKNKLNDSESNYTINLSVSFLDKQTKEKITTNIRYECSQRPLWKEVSNVKYQLVKVFYPNATQIVFNDITTK